MKLSNMQLKYKPGDSSTLVKVDVDAIMAKTKRAIVAEITAAKGPVTLVVTVTKEPV